MWRLRSTLFLVPGLAASVGAVLCMPKKRNNQPKTRPETYSVCREQETILLVTETEKIMRCNKSMLKEAKVFLDNYVKEDRLDGTDIQPKNSNVRLDNQAPNANIWLSIISNNYVGESQEFLDYQLQWGDYSISLTLIPANEQERPSLEEVTLGIMYSAKHEKKVLIPTVTQVCKLKELKDEEIVIIQKHETKN